MQKFRVTFYPDNKSVEVAKNDSILSAAISCGININSACGGDGVCGKCKVIVKKGKITAKPTGMLSPEEKKRNIYLACLASIHSDLEVDLLPDSREKDREAKLFNAGSGDRLKGNFGLAVDIGTTTISVQLVDLNSERVLGTKSAYNKQSIFGADVITRIIFAKQKDGLEKLHSAVSSTINQVIKELVQEQSIDLNDITKIVCTGNTTMMHLLLRMDPSHIRRIPYIPGEDLPSVLKASEAGININSSGLLYCVSAVANYIGGDTTSGVLSSGLYKEDDLSVLIDIGTNGEIALGNSDFIIASAASAGPAFEGSGVACGMRASIGAIQSVKINPKDLSVGYDTIGNAKPVGICGSGYISLIAEMLSAKVIDKSGKIKIEDNKRIRLTDLGREFIVAFKEESDTVADIVITEADIENLKRAKAAIYSATATLIKHMDFEPSDIKKIFIAGGFGTSLEIESAIRIGLLPDLERSRFIFIGNSALAGAKQMLLSYHANKESEDIARKITYFDLSLDPGYMDEYMAALFFPHTNLGRFPSLNV